MKKMLSLMLSCSLYTIALNAITVYEDAEDQKTIRWKIYDSSPNGAKISNCYDAQKKSRVIKFEGKNLQNGYILRNEKKGLSSWNNQSEKVITWKMKYQQRFVIYIRVKTTQGSKYIYYTNSNRNYGVQGNYIHFGLGKNATNGKWQTVRRNLEADLKKYQPNNKLLAVNAFLIRGNGVVDDIQLSKAFSPLKISNVHAEEISKDKSTIFWDLNAYATGQVEYGESKNYGNFSKKETSFKYNHHEQLLHNLKPSTIYHYRVISKDKHGQSIKSEDHTFTTLGLKISNVHSEAIGDKNCTIFWDLNEYATGQVEYGESMNYGKFSKKESSFNYNHHEQLLRNLKPNTRYHYRVTSEDEQGESVMSEDYTFKTLNDQTLPPSYMPHSLPENIVRNEAMNMDSNHPKFGRWTKPNLIVNGYLELINKDDNSYYLLPDNMGKPHHKYTLVWDMETIGEANQDEHASVRINLFGYLQGGFQNTVYNKKETLYAVVVSKDDLSPQRQSLQMSKKHNPNNTHLKISNIRLYDGVIELPKPTYKDTSFNAYIGMDKEGVFRRNNKVIFPINIYKDNTLFTKGDRTVYQYLDQGISGTLMEAVGESWSDATEDRISTIVSKGITTVSIPITEYLKNPDYKVGSVRFNDFKEAIALLQSQPEIWKGIGALSIDNEFYHKNQQFKDTIREIRGLVPDKPIQMLNGVEGMSAWYNDYVDITGTYIANDHKADDVNFQEATSNIHQLESQRLTPNLNHPATLLQMNQGANLNFGSILMAGVAIGGTKLEYWKDAISIRKGFRNLNMVEDPMWDQLPTLRTYLNKMCDLGIIESTPYIGFKITQTNDTYEYIKARYGKGNKAYIIASNMTTMTEERTIGFKQDYEGLHYQPTGNLKDIITGEIKGEIDAKTQKINITLAPHQWVVLEVEQ